MRSKLFFIITVLIVLILGVSIGMKERLLAGKTFYMRLRPVDPRSLMQGDYMALRYDVNFNNINLDKTREACLVLDEKRVASYLMDSMKEKCNDEGNVWVKASYHNGNYELAPTSFFFQEGHAPIYNNAKHGVFAYDGKGGVLLKGLADAQLKELKP